MLLIYCYRTSLQYGISCLKRLNYDRQQLEERRRVAESANIDVLVWSNDRVIRWVQSIGLKVGQVLFNASLRMAVIKLMKKNLYSIYLCRNMEIIF